MKRWQDAIKKNKYIRLFFWLHISAISILPVSSTFADVLSNACTQNETGTCNGPINIYNELACLLSNFKYSTQQVFQLYHELTLFKEAVRDIKIGCLSQIGNQTAYEECVSNGMNNKYSMYCALSAAQMQQTAEKNCLNNFQQCTGGCAYSSDSNVIQTCMQQKCAQLYTSCNATNNSCQNARNNCLAATQATACLTNSGESSYSGASGQIPCPAPIDGTCSAECPVAAASGLNNCITQCNTSSTNALQGAQAVPDCSGQYNSCMIKAQSQNACNAVCSAPDCSEYQQGSTAYFYCTQDATTGPGTQACINCTQEQQGTTSAATQQCTNARQTCQDSVASIQQNNQQLEQRMLSEQTTCKPTCMENVTLLQPYLQAEQAQCESEYTSCEQRATELQQSAQSACANQQNICNQWINPRLQECQPQLSRCQNMTSVMFDQQNVALLEHSCMLQAPYLSVLFLEQLSNMYQSLVNLMIFSNTYGAGIITGVSTVSPPDPGASTPWDQWFEQKQMCYCGSTGQLIDCSKSCSANDTKWTFAYTTIKNYSQNQTAISTALKNLKYINEYYTTAITNCIKQHEEEHSKAGLIGAMVAAVGVFIIGIVAVALCEACGAPVEAAGALILEGATAYGGAAAAAAATIAAAIGSLPAVVSVGLAFALNAGIMAGVFTGLNKAAEAIVNDVVGEVNIAAIQEE